MRKYIGEAFSRSSTVTITTGGVPAGGRSIALPPRAHFSSMKRNATPAKSHAIVRKRTRQKYGKRELRALLANGGGLDVLRGGNAKCIVL